MSTLVPDTDWLTAEERQTLTGFLDGWLGCRASERLFPGFSVAIEVRGQPVYARGFGLADTLGQTEFSVKHAVCVGSQSKMMTAMLVLRLIHEGRLSLHDEAGKFLPWLAKHRDMRVQHITIEQLLSHRSGLPRDGVTADFWLQKVPFPDAAALRQLVLDSDMTYPNGLHTKYSNLGYALLGQIIEAASGRLYHELAKDYIIKPLGLTDTWVNATVPQGRQLATGYTRHIDGRRQQLPQYIPTNAYTAATGWYSTPSDMAKIMRLFTDPEAGFLPQTKMEEFWQDRGQHWQPAVPSRAVYGYGALATEVEGRRIIGHSGGFITYCSCSYADVERGVVVSVAGNTTGTPVNEIAMGLFGVLEHFVRSSGQPTLPELQPLSGVYENVVGSRAILVVGSSVVSVPLDEWSPFDAVDTLEPFGSGTLRISDDNFLAVAAELVRYEAGRPGIGAGATASVQHITYAGMSLYRRQ